MTMTELTSYFLSYMLFSGTSGNYIRATWNWAKSHMWLTSHRLSTPNIYESSIDILHISSTCILFCRNQQLIWLFLGPIPVYRPFMYW